MTKAELTALVERVERGAHLSEDGIYRYLLWRRWDGKLPHALFIMLNPSTADGTLDDPTIRRCVGFAKSWNMGGLRVVNLYPFRATKPADLWKATFPRGTENIEFIKRAIDPLGICIAAWGEHGKDAQVSEVKELFSELGVPLFALKLNAGGAPAHPLYIPADAKPIPYHLPRNALRAKLSQAPE